MEDCLINFLNGCNPNTPIFYSFLGGFVGVALVVLGLYLIYEPIGGPPGSDTPGGCLKSLLGFVVTFCIAPFFLITIGGPKTATVVWGSIVVLFSLAVFGAIYAMATIGSRSGTG